MSRPEPAPPPNPSAPIAHLVVAGVAGLAVTVLEFAAVRFMAPSFGQSNYVWANVIGVILLSLSIGYWIGGRWADRSQSARPLFLAYLFAAIYAASIAFLGRPLCEWLVPEGVGNARMLPLAFTGSLIATLLLFAAPVVVLGMTSPFLIRLGTQEGHSGRTAGRIFAVGTIGSLVGCYLAPLWLLQAIGSRATILASAATFAALGLAGLLALGPRARRAVGVAGILFATMAGLAVYATAADWPLRRQDGQLVEVESTYQTIRVVEEAGMIIPPGEYPLYGDTETVPTRFLRHDEDTDTYQSAWIPGRSADLMLGGRYYGHLSLGSWFWRPHVPETLRVLIIGYAGGALHRALRTSAPPDTTFEVLGVEIDPAVVDVAREWMDLGSLESDALRLVTGEDARTVVNALPSTEVFDLILVDAYARTAYVPFQLATTEFFQRLKRHLAPGGWIGLNLHAPGGLSSRLARALSATMGATDGLGRTYGIPNPNFMGNMALWAGAAEAGAPRLRGDVEIPATLRAPAFALERLGAAVSTRGAHVLTDDRSDIDRLSDEDYSGR